MAQRLRVWVDRETCISNGLCAMAAPDHFEIRDDNRSHAIQSPTEATEEVWKAVRGCPVNAIHAEDADTGEHLHPPA